MTLITWSGSNKLFSPLSLNFATLINHAICKLLLLHSIQVSFLQRLKNELFFPERQLLFASHNTRSRGYHNRNYSYYSQLPQFDPSVHVLIEEERRSGRSGHSASDIIRTTTTGPRVRVDTNENNDEESCSLSSSEEGSSLDITLSNSLPLPPTRTSSSSISTCDTFSSPSRLGLVQTFTLRPNPNPNGGTGPPCDQPGSVARRRNEIFHQRQRRLRLIRMEIEDLTLQLSSLSEGKKDNTKTKGRIGFANLEEPTNFSNFTL